MELAAARAHAHLCETARRGAAAEAQAAQAAWEQQANQDSLHLENRAAQLQRHAQLLFERAAAAEAIAEAAQMQTERVSA